MVNFLMICTDQHRADYLSCAGHPVVRTPNIDSIAAHGTMYNRFYVANPVCMPNRSAMLTGRFTSVSGVRHNGIPIPLEANTFADMLRAAGYHTALIGKAHFQCMTESEPELGPNPSGQNARNRAPGNYSQERPSAWAEKGRAAMELPYYGFDHVDLSTGHGDRAGAAHRLDQQAALGDPDALQGATNQLPHAYTCPQAVRTAIPEEQYSTAWIRDRAVDYLRDEARKDQPFFAFVSFPDPHHPFNPPGKYWDMYDPADMVIPESFHTQSNTPPPHLKWLRENTKVGEAKGMGAALVTEQQLREAIALTCGMIAMIDDAVGSILDTLEQRGLSEDTVIIFTSDHGDFLGDHGMILKGPMHYQATTRVPFIWAEPGGTAQRSDRLSSAIDLAPSILARAGVQPYHGMQGRVLSQPQTRVLIEDEGNRASLGFATAPRLRTLVTPTHRLSVYLNADWGELYDLQADPAEITNLWDAPDAQVIKAELMMALTQELIRAADPSPWPEALA